METNQFEDREIRDAFGLIEVLLGNRTETQEALTKALIKLKTHPKEKRTYYKAKWRRNRIVLDRQLLLQYLLLVCAEEFERKQEQEFLKGNLSLDEQRMVLRFIKKLLSDSMFKMSFHTTVALTRILHNYTSSQARRIYEFLVRGEDLSKSDDSIREERIKGMASLKQRFSPFVTTYRGERREERFLAMDDSKQMYDLVEKWLRLLTPWGTPCALPESLDARPPEISSPAHDGKQQNAEKWPSLLRRRYRRRDDSDAPDAINSIERSRIRTMIENFPWIISKLNYAPPRERVEVPKFSFLNPTGSNSGPPINLDDLTEPTDKEINEIYRELLRQSGNRKNSSSTVLAFIVDGVERARASLEESDSIQLELSEDDDLIEVVAKEKEGDILLSTLSLRYSGAFDEEQPWESSIVLEGGQQLSMRALLRSDPTARRLVLEISYKETNPIRALRLLAKRMIFRITKNVPAVAVDSWRAIKEFSRRNRKWAIAIGIILIFLLSARLVIQPDKGEVDQTNPGIVENKDETSPTSPRIAVQEPKSPSMTRPEETHTDHASQGIERACVRPERKNEQGNKPKPKDESKPQSPIEENRNAAMPKSFAAPAGTSGSTDSLLVRDSDVSNLLLMIPDLSDRPALREHDNQVARLPESALESNTDDIFFERSIPREDRHALVIGVDTYAYSQSNRIRRASEDAEAISETLIRYAGFAKEHVTVLASNLSEANQPTKANIYDNLFSLRKATTKDGMVLIAFAGHGVMYEGQPYLVASDTMLDDPISVKHGGISVNMIREWGCETGANQAVLMLDTSFDFSPAGISAFYDTISMYSGQYLCRANPERQLHTRTDKRGKPPTVTVLSPLSGRQVSGASEWRSGFLTQAFLDGLKGGAANDQGVVSMAGLYDYVIETLPRLEAQLKTGPAQAAEATPEVARREDKAIGSPSKTEDPHISRYAGSMAQSKAGPEGATKYFEKRPKGFTTADSFPFRDYRPRSFGTLPKVETSKSASESRNNDRLSGVWDGTLLVSDDKQAFTLQLETTDTSVVGEWAYKQGPVIKLRGRWSANRLELAGEREGESFSVVATLKNGDLVGRRYIDNQLLGVWDATKRLEPAPYFRP